MDFRANLPETCGLSGLFVECKIKNTIFDRQFQRQVLKFAPHPIVAFLNFFRNFFCNLLTGHVVGHIFLKLTKLKLKLGDFAFDC